MKMTGLCHGGIVTGINTRGRRLVLALAVLTLFILVVVGVVLHGWIREERWIRRLASKDLGERKIACERLGEIGTARAIPRILELWRNTWDGRELQAPRPLSRTDKEIPLFTAPLLVKLCARFPDQAFRGLEDRDSAVRLISAWVFQSVPAPPEALSPLAGALKDPLVLMRTRAALALLNAGPGLRPIIASALESDPELRSDLVNRFRDVDSLPKLLELLEIAGPEFAARALPAIQGIRIDPEFARADRKARSSWIQVLHQAFRKGTVETRIELCSMIAGHTARELVADLMEAANGADRRLRKRAIIALGETGPPAREAIPLLSDALGESDDGIRRLAEDALNKIRAEKDE
jgi:HEAT repeat protein